MQTFFNPTTPFFDDEGRPMVGARVSFLDLETRASLIALTDSSGTPLPNPIFTGSDGRLRLQNGVPAVPCIADGLSYKVSVEKRTGVEPVYSGGILQNPGELYEAPYIVFVVTAAGGGSGGSSGIFGSVADVRVAPKTLGAVTCSGYYAAGDCPSRVFTWVESAEPLSDNGVNVLRNPEDDTGYWLMSDPDAGTWDVRIAGMSTENDPNVNSVRLQALLNIVGQSENPTTRSSRIYFPRGVYALSSGFTSYSEVVFGLGAKISLVGASAKTLKFVGGIEAFGIETVPEQAVISVPSGGGLLNVECGQGVFRTSWIAAGVGLSRLAINDTLVVDSDDRDVVSAGAHTVVFEAVVTRNVNLSDCDVVCHGKLNGGIPNGTRIIFTGCRFSDRYFVDGTFDISKVSLSGCIVDIDDFKSVDYWAQAMLYNGAKILDFKGRSCLSLAIRVTEDGSSYKVLDGNIGTLTFGGDVSNSIELTDCSGRLVLLNEGYTTATLKGCTMSVATPVVASATPPRLYADTSAIVFEGGSQYSGVTMRRTSCSGSVVNVIGPLFLDYCDTACAIAVNGDCTIRKSTIGANVEHTAGGTLNMVLVDNVLNAVYSFGGTTAGTVVHATITGNVGTVSNPVMIDRTNLDGVDSHHSYSYSNNSGTFIPDSSVPKAMTVHVKYAVIASGQIPEWYMRVDGLNNLVRDKTGGVIFIDGRNTCFDAVQFFRIGTDRFPVKARLDGYSKNFFYQSPNGSYHDALVGAYFREGFTFDIRAFWDDATAAMGDKVSSLQNTLFRGLKTFSLEDSVTDYDEPVMISYTNLARIV